MAGIRRRASSRFLLLVLTLSLWPAGLQAAEPRLEPSGDEYQLLANPGLEYFDSPYTQYEGINCQVASHWQRFWHDGAEPYWMDTRVFAYSPLGGNWVEKIEGATSQLVWSITCSICSA